jgi:hypothetical protein
VHGRVVAGQLARQVQKAGARDVASLVVGAAGFRMVRHARTGLGRPQPGGALEDSQIRIAQVGIQPVGLDQRFGVVVEPHVAALPRILSSA